MHLIKVHQIGQGITGNEKWLTVDRHPYSSGRIVIARSPRYQNDSFPWKEVVKRYGWKLLFVGLDFEWRDFVSKFGYVEHYHIQDMLEFAQLIEGSELMICNQSCSNALSEGLKHRQIQETCLWRADCIWIRPNIQHVYDGVCHFPGFDGEPDFQTRPERQDLSKLSTVKAPPGKWQFDGIQPNVDFDHVAREIRMLPNFRGKTLEECKHALLSATLDRCPNFWRGKTDLSQVMSAFKDAKQLS
jgi:hypothetical protein